jgi:hypothetical protein
MEIVDLAQQPAAIVDQAATLLAEEFDAPRGWPTLDAARDEVATVPREGFGRAMLDLGRMHPFLFYRKLGYVVTGVMPDANGRGRPDIFMSKRLSAASGSPAGSEPR